MSKNKGVIRKLDKLGRVVIPKEIRDRFEIVEDSPLEIFVDGNSIQLKKFIPNCVFCGSVKGLNEFREKIVCEKCKNNIENLHSNV